MCHLQRAQAFHSSCQPQDITWYVLVFHGGDFHTILGDNLPDSPQIRRMPCGELYDILLRHWWEFFGYRLLPLRRPRLLKGSDAASAMVALIFLRGNSIPAPLRVLTMQTPKHGQTYHAWYAGGQSPRPVFRTRLRYQMLQPLKQVRTLAHIVRWSIPDQGSSCTARHPGHVTQHVPASQSYRAGHPQGPLRPGCHKCSQTQGIPVKWQVPLPLYQVTLPQRWSVHTHHLSRQNVLNLHGFLASTSTATGWGASRPTWS